MVLLHAHSGVYTWYIHIIYIPYIQRPRLCVCWLRYPPRETAWRSCAFAHTRPHRYTRAICQIKMLIINQQRTAGAAKFRLFAMTIYTLSIYLKYTYTPHHQFWRKSESTLSLFYFTPGTHGYFEVQRLSVKSLYPSVYNNSRVIGLGLG